MISDSVFCNALISAFKNWRNFSGRTSRHEYWLCCLLFIPTSIFTNRYSAFFIETMPITFVVLYIIVSLYLLILGMSLMVRRLHDAGFSGYRALWILLPVFGMILFIYWVCKPSEHMPNKWGEPPATPPDYLSMFLDIYLLIFVLFFLLPFAFVMYK